MHWSAREVAVATGGVVEAGGRGDRSLSGVGIDSRSLPADSLFVALRAERDGHAWVDAAVRAGAGALLVDGTWAGSPPGMAYRAASSVPVVVVADTAAALLALGATARRRLGAKVVGITGSVGKTSTKDLAAAALAATRRTAASTRSFNNEIGVPLTLANAPDDTEVTVVEMGARGPGQIARLCQVARPDIGVVTAVAAAHTEVFGDLDTVASAKSELVASLPVGGTAVLNADDPRVVAMRTATGARVVRYSAGGLDLRHAEVVAEGIQLDEDLRPRFVARTPWGTVDVSLSARGAHQVGNALAALAVAAQLGVPLDDAAGALRHAPLSPWRMELRHTLSGAAILNDAYNANPASMAAALEALAALPASRRVAVLGEMAELGSRRAEEHRAIVSMAERLGLELLAVGTEAYGTAAVVGIEGVPAALGPLGANDTVLIKASRVAGLERVAARLLADEAP